MEQEIIENPYFQTFLTPANPLSPHRRRSSPLETHPSSPLGPSFHHSYADQIQHIDSAFSRLALSSDPRFNAQTPSFLGHIPLSPSESAALSFREPLFQGNNTFASGGTNGFFGAHHRLNVGPEPMSFPGGSGPYTHAVEPRLPAFRQSLDLYDGYYNGHYSLHGKEHFSRNAGSCYPISPRVQRQSNLYRRHQQQQIDTEILRGKIVSLAKDQMWSGPLSLEPEDGLTEQEIDLILPQVDDCLSDLMRNQFGSHFVQKLFAACNEEQRTRIIVALTKSPFKLVTICLNSYGARAVQKLLEKLSTPQQASMVVSALCPGAVSLATDPSGHHVIQYCVRNFAGEYSKILFNEIVDNCFKIATNKSGCCVLPSCVEYSKGEARQRLITEIIANAVHLAEDPYGNYVVQHLLGLGMHDVQINLLRRLQGSFVALSCNKYASNVVEKLLRESSENHTAAIIMELLTSPNASMLLLDPFGNFVIQSALSLSKGHVHDALLSMIQANASSMQSNLYGKKILASFEKKKLRNVL